MMKFKKLNSLALCALISSASFAYTGDGFTILSDTETMSSGTQGYFRDVTSQKKTSQVQKHHQLSQLQK